MDLNTLFRTVDDQPYDDGPIIPAQRDKKYKQIFADMMQDLKDRGAKVYTYSHTNWDTVSIDDVLLTCAHHLERGGDDVDFIFKFGVSDTSIAKCDYRDTLSRSVVVTRTKFDEWEVRDLLLWSKELYDDTESRDDGYFISNQCAFAPKENDGADDVGGAISRFMTPPPERKMRSTR